ncbi:hypothetical protein V5O48_010939 [Marasmius crinis-equi]|uniref:Uncharacterized protein n=1 Tax=Marasmius crinis-equi TaxID=585013 RepID=A0ABR3F7A3_9AGAR
MDYPPQQVKLILSCLKTLAPHLERASSITMTLVWRSWTGVLEKWIVFFLTTPEEVHLMDNTPFFCRADPPQRRSRCWPNHNLLILHVWFRDIERNHPSLRQWTRPALVSIQPVSTDLNHTSTKPLARSDGFHTNRDTVLVQHFNRLELSPPEMTGAELQDFRAYHSLLASDRSVDDLDREPFLCDRIFVQMVTTIYLLICICKYTQLTADATSTTQQIQAITRLSLDLINLFLVNPRRAEQVLEHRFIQAVLSGTLLSGNEEVSTVQIIEILTEISRYLLNHGVLGAFIRASRKERAKRRALTLYDIRRQIKTRVGFCTDAPPFSALQGINIPVIPAVRDVLQSFSALEPVLNFTGSTDTEMSANEIGNAKRIHHTTTRLSGGM